MRYGSPTWQKPIIRPYSSSSGNCAMTSTVSIRSLVFTVGFAKETEIGRWSWLACSDCSTVSVSSRRSAKCSAVWCSSASSARRLPTSALCRTSAAVRTAHRDRDRITSPFFFRNSTAPISFQTHPFTVQNAAVPAPPPRPAHLRSARYSPGAGISAHGAWSGPRRRGSSGTPWPWPTRPPDGKR